MGTGAALTVLVATRMGLPISTTHPAMHLKGVQARFIDPGTGERVHVAGFRHQVLDYVGAAVRAGFHVDHISEHRPDEALARRLPRAARYIGHPMVLVMRLRLPLALGIEEGCGRPKGPRRQIPYFPCSAP